MITMAAPREKVVSKSTKKVAPRRVKRAAVPSGHNASAGLKQKSAAPKQEAAPARIKRGAIKPPPPDPITLLSEIREIYAKYAEDELTKKYKIGKRLKTGEGDPRRYGEKFVAKVASELDLSETTLYRWKDVAVCFPEDSFQRARSQAAEKASP